MSGDKRGRGKGVLPLPKPTRLIKSNSTFWKRTANGLWRVEDKFGLKFTCRVTANLKV